MGGGAAGRVQAAPARRVRRRAATERDRQGPQGGRRGWAETMMERWSRIAARRWRAAGGILVGVFVGFVIVMVVPHDIERVLIPGELMLLAAVIATVIGGRM